MGSINFITPLCSVKPTPHGHFIKKEKKVNNLYSLLEMNFKRPTYDNDQFAVSLSVDSSHLNIRSRTLTWSS